MLLEKIDITMNNANFLTKVVSSDKFTRCVVKVGLYHAKYSSSGRLLELGTTLLIRFDTHESYLLLFRMI